MADYEALIGEVKDLFDDGWCVCRSSHLPTDLLNAVETLVAGSADLERRYVNASHIATALQQERDALRGQLNSVRKYAEDRAAYGRRNRTVGSARIASDLFAILDAEQTLSELAGRQAQPNGLEGVL